MIFPVEARVLSLFTTGYAWSNWAPGSILIHVQSLKMSKIVEDHLGFASAFDRLANANTSVQVRDQLVQSMRNSDPRVRIVFVHRFNSNFHYIWTLQVTGCDFNTGPIFGAHSNPTFRVSWFFILCKVYSLHYTGSAICKNSSMCFVMKFCPTSTVFKNPASNRSGCGSLSTRSLYFCNKFCARISIEMSRCHYQ